MANRREEREVTGSQGPGIQQQSGWNRFFDHGLGDLIPDTQANGGGCLIVYDSSKRVEKFGSGGEKRWEGSYEPSVHDLLPIGEASGGGYLIAFDNELVRLRRDGSPQWQRSYGSADEMGNIISVIEAGSDGFVFVGRTERPPSVNWVVKVNGDSTVVWELKKYFDGGEEDYGQAAYDVHRAQGGGYLVEVGKYNSRVLMKVDEDGAIEWDLEFTEYSEIYVTEEGSVLVAALYEPTPPRRAHLVRVTGEGTRQWTNESESTNLPRQVLEGESGFLVAGWDSDREDFVLEMLRDDGTRRWRRSYDRRYTIAHGEPDGYVLFGTDTVLKINGDGSNEWERPLYVPTSIEYLYHLDDGGYLLGDSSVNLSWVALRENLAGGLAVLPDVNGDGNPSQDPDGDGLYEDVNGDGSVNVGDAQALYNNRDAAAIRINSELYDFNDDGEANVGDAQALFAEVTEDD